MVVQYDASLRESRTHSFTFDNVITLQEGREFTDVMALQKWLFGYAIVSSYSIKH